MISRSEAQAIVDAILALWQIATPIPVIAETMAIPQRLVIEIIESNTSSRARYQPATTSLITGTERFNHGYF